MIYLNPQWWTTFSSIVTDIWNIATMLADILSTVLLFVILALTVFIRIAVWIPGPQPEAFLISIRNYLTKFIDKISFISRKKI